VVERIQRDVDSGPASGQVPGTPTLFIDGVVHRGGCGPPTWWRRWRHQGDQKPRRSLTMIAVTRPGVITL
jgi:hypothetical protein